MILFLFGKGTRLPLLLFLFLCVGEVLSWVFLKCSNCSSQQLRYVTSTHFKRDPAHPNWRELEVLPPGELEEGDHVGPQLSGAGITKIFLARFVPPL